MHSFIMRVFIYIDGFNFYHLRLKRQRGFRWLDLGALGRIITPDATSEIRVNYYTARVSSKIDASAPARQQAYLSALGTVPNVHIHYGNFLFSEKMAFLCQPPESSPSDYIWNLPPPRLVKIAKAEEKGSDVNLASHLVRDALLDRFDQALVLSNDTDLIEPIRIVTREVAKPVGIVAPCHQRERGRPIPSPSLQKVSTFIVQIDDHQLAAAQFPAQVIRADGSIVERPLNWA